MKAAIGDIAPVDGFPVSRYTTVSVIIPVSERHDDLGEIFQEYKQALKGVPVELEFLFVLDGEYPKTYQELKALKESGEDFILVKHARTFGEAAAITSGFRQSKGELILTLPSYRQIEASELPRLFAGLEGFAMIAGRRWPRSDSWINRLQTRCFHLMVKALAGDVVEDVGCGVRLFRREVLEEINLYGDLHRFLPILAAKHGYKVNEINLRQSKREKRVRTYPLGVYVRRMIDLLTVFFLVKFTKKPLRFFGLTGSLIILVGLAVTLYVVVSRLFYHVALSDRPLFLVGILFLVLGIQIFSIGLVGEILIFTHAREIREYHIEEIIH